MHVSHTQARLHMIKVKEQSILNSTFQRILSKQLPNTGMLSQNALDIVYNMLVCKLCNARTQEVVSAASQQLACKKRLFRQFMLMYYQFSWYKIPKVESKFGTKESKKSCPNVQNTYKTVSTNIVPLCCLCISDLSVSLSL